MKKIFYLFLLVQTIFGGEFDFGHGTFQIKGGFLGLTDTIKSDVTSFTLATQHKNIFSSNWYYRYNLTWFSSKELVNAQKTIAVYTKTSSIKIDDINSSSPEPITNPGTGDNPNPGEDPGTNPGTDPNPGNYSNTTYTTITSPITDYKYKGLDANLIFGKDLFKTQSFIFGAGILAGISIPVIESKKDSNDNTSSLLSDSLKKSKTKITTYKLGANVIISKKFTKYIRIFISSSYAYQRGNVKNNYADININANGKFFAYEGNIRLVPFSYKTKIWFITLTPKLYFTIGYRYSYWDLKKIAIDITGNNLNIPKTTLKMQTKITYLGIGYSF